MDLVPGMNENMANVSQKTSKYEASMHLTSAAIHIKAIIIITEYFQGASSVINTDYPKH